jgi:hypothetical protein
VLALVVILVALAPNVLEVVVGASVAVLGMLWLAGKVVPGRGSRLLGVLLAIVALVEATKRH